VLLDALAVHCLTRPGDPLPAPLVERVLRAAELLAEGRGVECAIGWDLERRDMALRRAAECLVADPASAPYVAAAAVLQAHAELSRVRAPTAAHEALQAAESYGPMPRSRRQLARILMDTNGGKCR